MRLNANWREFVKENLKGVGVELGPLHQPFAFNTLTTHVDYVDRASRKALIAAYGSDPGVRDLIKNIPEIDFIVPSYQLPIASGTYDFVCHAHLLEHLSNPGAALAEWFRVLKPHGKLFMCVPDMRFTFDHARQLTSIDHLWAHFTDRIDDEISRAEYVEYLSVVRKIHDEDTIDNLYRDQHPIHAHTFISESLLEFILGLSGAIPFELLMFQSLGMHILIYMEKRL